MLFSLQKENLLICKFVTKWMNMEDITIRETSQSKKDKQFMIPFTRRILKK